MPERTGSSTEVVHIEDGKRVYPCRCGETHRGEHAVYDYGHHNCFHEAPLERLDETGDVMCPQCGKTWAVRNTP